MEHFLEFGMLVRFCDIEDQGKKHMDSAIIMSYVSPREYIFLWLYVKLFPLFLFCDEWLYFLSKQITPPI